MCGVLSTRCFESLFSDLLLLSLRVRLSVVCGRLRQFVARGPPKKETKKALNVAAAAYVTDPHTFQRRGKSLSYIEYIQLTSILRDEKRSFCRISGQSTRLCLALAITLRQLARSKSNEQTRIYNSTTIYLHVCMYIVYNAVQPR